MTQEELQQPVTKEYLGDFTEKVTIPAVEDIVKNAVVRLETKLPDKDYLDHKLAELRGDIIVKIKQQENKMNFIIEILKKKNLINDDELNKLKEFDIFPSVEDLKTQAS